MIIRQKHRTAADRGSAGVVALSLTALAVFGTAGAIVYRFTVAAPRDAVVQVQKERLVDGLDTALAAAVENVRRDAGTCTARTVDLDDVDNLGGGRIRAVVDCAVLGGDRYRFTSTGYLRQDACAPSGDDLSAVPVLTADVTLVQAARDARSARIDRQTLDGNADRCKEAPG